MHMCLLQRDYIHVANLEYALRTLPIWDNRNQIDLTNQEIALYAID